MKANLIEWLADAYANHYAVPAFDYSGFWDAAAILETAREEKSPVILMTLTLMSDIVGIESVGAIGRAAVNSSSSPAFLHLEHCFGSELCKQAVLSGYDSVMIDASKYELRENIRRTKEIVEFAHKNGVYVEAEIGRIMGNTIEGEYVGDDYLTVTSEAKQLVEETGADFLAVGIGTQHGVYIAPPKLNFDRLCEINEALRIPLVMHGGTGVPQEDVRHAISLGISKVNVGTDIMQALVGNVYKTLKENDGCTSSFMAIHPAYEEIKEVVRRWIRTCNANGRIK
jgi:ketose-bisphosphate aldolase